MARRYRCTVCGVETLSSKACPRCGRRSTLVPVDGEAGPEEPNLARPGSEPPPRRKQGVRGLLAVGLVVAVGAAVAAVVLATGGRKRPRAEPSEVSDSPTSRRPASPSSRPRGSPRELCGRAFCLVSRMAKAGPQGGGLLETRHCFLLPKAPTAGRIWYVPVVHLVSWRATGSREPVALLRLTPEEAWASDQAKVWLGGLAADVAEGENPMGRKLFYLAQRPLGFAMAAPPTVTRPLLLQFATLVFTAAALTPNPPGPKADTWLDSRPLALPVQCPPRSWSRETQRAGGLAWRLRTERKEPTQGAKGNASGKIRPMDLEGRAHLDEQGRLHTSVTWRAGKVHGSLDLGDLGARCLDGWKDWAVAR